MGSLGSYLVEDELWVIMRLMELGALTEVVLSRRLTEGEAALVCRDCLLALEYLHSRGIIHRDIKSDSILLDSQGRVRTENDTGGQLLPSYLRLNCPTLATVRVSRAPIRSAADANPWSGLPTGWRPRLS